MFNTINTNGSVPVSNAPIKKGQGDYASKAFATDTNCADFRTSGAIDQAPDSKAIATQLARLALAGHAVHKGSVGYLTVCKYAMVRYCKDFAALQAFARQVGVKS